MIPRKTTQKKARTKTKKGFIVYLYVGEGKKPFTDISKAYVGEFQDIMDIVNDFREQLKKHHAKVLLKKKLPSATMIKKELKKDGYYSEAYHIPKKSLWVELKLTTEPFPVPFNVRLIDLRKIRTSPIGRYHPIVWR